MLDVSIQNATRGSTMSNPLKTRAGMIAGTAVAVLALAGIAGATVANADDSTPKPSASSSPSTGTTDGTARDARRPVEEALTGDAAAKVQAAVEAKYPGATIERMEKDGDGTSVYEAHITKADGTHVTVLFDAGFAITGEEAMGQRGPGGRGGPGGHGGRGHHGPGADADGAGDAGAATSSSTTAA
jgi:uncharacterized membrane protein YkoI